MKTQHATPGPWHIGLRTAHSKRDVYGTRGELIALADGVFTPLAEAQANARLIAAAPDMLAALQELCADPYLSQGLNDDRMAKAREAIAQATGETV